MPPDPNLLLIFVSMLAALLASLAYAAWYQQFKHRHKTGKRDAVGPATSVGLSELEGLIRKAISEGTLPLDERLASVEEELHALRSQLSKQRLPLPPAADTGLRIDVRDQETEADEEPVPARKRVR